MNRGVDKQRIFFADRDRVEFGRQLGETYERFGLTVLAYCLMDNHYHLLVRSEPGTLSAAMQYLVGVYTRRTNERVGRDGPLFRGRFHAIPVLDDGYLKAAFRYIHRNPLDLPGVDRIDGYRWSSFRSHARLRRPPEFLDVDTMLDVFDGDVEGLVRFHDHDGWLDGVGVDDAATTLDQLIELAIALDNLAQDVDAAVPSQLSRTIALLLEADVDLPEAVVEALSVPPSGSEARRHALRRARSRHASDPTVERVLTLLRPHLTRSVVV